MMRSDSITSEASLRPAPPPYTRRTSRASSHLPRRCAGRCRWVDAPGQPRRDLLEQPTVAVGIMERGERAVAAMLGVPTADPLPPKQVGLIWASVYAAGVMEHLADLDGATQQLSAGRLDVGDDQI